MTAALALVVERVRAARADKTPLNIRGGGSKAFYGEAAQGQPLDVTGLAGISSYEPSELVVTVQAGTPLAELEATLAESGQCLPFEPPRFASTATVGGMVAAGLAGPARAAVGGVRDYVLGATLLNGRGELLAFGGTVMKNVAGYDVSRALAGSMGCLGVICEVSLKVLPLAQATLTLRLEMDEAQAIQRINEWGGQPLPLNATAWWEGTLVLRLSGAVAAVHAARERLGGDVVQPDMAAGLAGPARAAVGGVRDYVLGATLLNGRAELLNFGGTVMKNVAGYDVSRALAGSMGCLGVIIEVSLKVLPLAHATLTLRLEMDEALAIQRLNEWGGQPLPLNASAWWEDALVLRLAGATAAVTAAREALGGEVVEAGLAEAFWRGLRDHGDEFFAGAARAVASGATLWRLSVPATTPPLGLSGEQLIEWGGAQRWLCTGMAALAVREAAAAAGGHATLFRAQDKRAGVFTPLQPPLDRIHRQLKAAFDPDGIFNPGRLYPGL